MNIIKHFLPYSLLVSLFNTLLLSYLNCCILAWGGCSSGNLNTLLLLQKRALRMINFVDFCAHTDTLFYKHRTFKDIYFHQLGSLMYQSVSRTLSSSISAIFILNSDIQTYPTQQASNFHLLFALPFHKRLFNMRDPGCLTHFLIHLKAQNICILLNVIIN